MIWLDSSELTATALPAAWLVTTGERPGTLAERSQLRRETARRIIGRQLGLPTDAIRIDHDGHGQPLLARPAGHALHLSLATRAGIVAVALSERPVGIDVERVDATATPPFAVLHPTEGAMLRALPEAAWPLAFARLWSAKEAYVKALGTGFARPPESFSIIFRSPDRFAVDDPSRRSGAEGASRIIENGGQEILAAAIVVLD